MNHPAARDHGGREVVAAAVLVAVNGQRVDLLDRVRTDSQPLASASRRIRADLHRAVTHVRPFALHAREAAASEREDHVEPTALRYGPVDLEAEPSRLGDDGRLCD